MNCEALVLLPGWQDSRGAKIERAIAVGLGFPVWLYELESTIANATATLRRFQ
ncbi:hypothetical protein ODI_R3046 [Orrella dioscoreae]|uniref:DUF4406 domain-containing protein n=1 Tax=Orrella dioscoreae TaxID=1851544 RepID=A0A1C3K3L6_9BURK|nr:hypothetical protein ODI_01765 [Orrella dioscoreae]SOE50897.1 hypothetical protein ODI_R3046 [Orrella dioscoreae]